MTAPTYQIPPLEDDQRVDRAVWIDRWQMFVDALTAGCPIPVNIEVIEPETVTVLHMRSAEDVHAWAAHFGTKTYDETHSGQKETHSGMFVPWYYRQVGADTPDPYLWVEWIHRLHGREARELIRAAKEATA